MAWCYYTYLANPMKLWKLNDEWITGPACTVACLQVLVRLRQPESLAFLYLYWVMRAYDKQVHARRAGLLF